MTAELQTGSKTEFESNWKTRKEAKYNHWSATTPRNQIQLAFRSHWEVFNELMGPIDPKGKKFLEVGCGRGSLSSYFADNGWDVTLLDYSGAVLEIAKEIFANNKHKAKFVQGDANELPFESDSFDVVGSIGLLEHFEDVKKPMLEQIRILKPDGWFFGYIVPERPENLQKYFNWINFLLGIPAKLFGKNLTQAKEPIFRSDLDSSHYLECLKGQKIKNLQTFGMYSMPMISHSPDFPFSLLPRPLEIVLTSIFRLALSLRKLIFNRHGWICKEENGQAFLVAFQKA